MKIAQINQNEDNQGKEISFPRKGGQTLFFKAPVALARDTRVTGLRSCKVNDGAVVFIDTDIKHKGEPREVRSRKDVLVTPFDKFDLMAAYDLSERRSEKLAKWMQDSFVIKD